MIASEAARTGTGQATPVPVGKFRGMPKLAALRRISPPGERAIANFAGDLPTGDLPIGDIIPPRLGIFGGGDIIPPRLGIFGGGDIIPPRHGIFGAGDVTGVPYPHSAVRLATRRTGESTRMAAPMSRGTAFEAKTAAKLVGEESTCMAASGHTTALGPGRYT